MNGWIQIVELILEKSPDQCTSNQVSKQHVVRMYVKGQIASVVMIEWEPECVYTHIKSLLAV